MKIAVVDPSRVVQKIVTACLEEAGHAVCCFCDAEAALERLDAAPCVDVLITSLQLHGMSGLDLIRTARADAGKRRALYVIVMSASSERSTLIESLDSGADDFIGKPPATPELLARLRVAERVARLQGELIRLATTDALTGALNRRAFFEAAGLQDRSEADAVAIFDIDRFKQVNDTFGHAAGDAVIAAVAGVASAHCATVGRLGGEEFGLLVPGGAIADAVALCETIRRRVAALAFPVPALRVTCSFGTGPWLPDEGLDEALKRADIALYAAKSRGRDRVIAATAPTPSAVSIGAVDTPRRRVRAAG